MQLGNCKQCGKLYMDNGSPLCPECAKAEQDEFDLVYSYVRDHAKASIADVAAETGVSPKTILAYLRQGKLLLDVSTPVLTCQNCGTSLQAGRFCAACQNELTKDLDRALGQPSARGQDHRMHSQEWHHLNKRR